jgi:hypothetical protein
MGVLRYTTLSYTMSFCSTYHGWLIRHLDIVFKNTNIKHNRKIKWVETTSTNKQTKEWIFVTWCVFPTHYYVSVEFFIPTNISFKSQVVSLKQNNYFKFPRWFKLAENHESGCRAKTQVTLETGLRSNARDVTNVWLNL